MADNKISISATGNKVSGEKAKAQEAQEQAIKKKQEIASQKADEARAEEEARQRALEEEREAKRKEAEEQRKAEEEEARKKAEAEKAQAEEAKKKLSATASAGAALAAAALGKAKKSGGLAKFKGFLIGLVIGLLGGVLGTVLLVLPRLKLPQIPSSLSESVKPVEEADLTLDNDGALGYTAADFQNAVLGGASEHQELIVFEQELSVPTTITKAGLGNLAIFSKMKSVTYYGRGVYTVDLSRMDSEHIRVDEKAMTVTIVIPHTVLQYVNAELDKTEFEETDKGLLAFGEIKLTPEETKLLETTVMDTMREKLDSQEMYDEADRFAILKTWEIFQPLITAVSPLYKVETVFE